MRYLHCLLKLADRIDTSNQDQDDSDFEDMDDSAQVQDLVIVDIDQIKL